MDHDSKDSETTAPIEPRPDPTSSGDPTADLWAVSYSEEEDRELTRAEVQAALERGEINGATIVWRPGMEDWAPLSEQPDFAALVAQGTGTAKEAPASTEPPPEVPPAPVSEKPPAPVAAPAAPPSVPSVPSTPSVPLLEEDQRFRPSHARYAVAGAALVLGLGAVVWWVEKSSHEVARRPPAQLATQQASTSPPPTPMLLPHQTPAGEMPSESAPDHPRGHLEPFNRIAALRVMGKAAQKAIRCRGRGAPAGVARLTVTFEPSGKMSAARIFQAPYAGTPTATCIVAKIGKPEVPPFSGGPVTIRVPVELY